MAGLQIVIVSGLLVACSRPRLVRAAESEAKEEKGRGRRSGSQLQQQVRVQVVWRPDCSKTRPSRDGAQNTA